MALEFDPLGTPPVSQSETPKKRQIQVQLIQALGIMGVKSGTLNNLSRLYILGSPLCRDAGRGGGRLAAPFPIFSDLIKWGFKQTFNLVEVYSTGPLVWQT